MNDFLFKVLDVDNLDEIKDECKNYALHFLNDNKIGVFPSDLDLFFKKCPKTSNWLKINIQNPDLILLVVTPPGDSKKNAHADRYYISPADNYNTTLTLAVNIGLFNEIKTYTCFYKYISGSKTEMIVNDTVPYIYYGKAELEEIGRYNLEKPVLLNTSQIHSVHNDTLENRVAISFRFKQDPWYLIQINQ